MTRLGRKTGPTPPQPMLGFTICCFTPRLRYLMTRGLSRQGWPGKPDPIRHNPFLASPPLASPPSECDHRSDLALPPSGSAATMGAGPPEAKKNRAPHVGHPSRVPCCPADEADEELDARAFDRSLYVGPGVWHWPSVGPKRAMCRSRAAREPLTPPRPICPCWSKFAQCRRELDNVG